MDHGESHHKKTTVTLVAGGVVISTGLQHRGSVVRSPLGVFSLDSICKEGLDC